MGETRPMQPLITVKGKKEGSGTVYAHNVIQPAPGWLHMPDAKSAVFHVNILALDGESGDPDRMPGLLIETAASAAGPWWEIARWETPGDVPVNDVVGASGRAPGFAADYTNYVERFVRWRIDASALTEFDDEWALCFAIDVTLK